MFGIEWLRNGSVVDRETSVLKTAGEVIANAYARAPEVAARLIGHEPDGFRLKDASGNDLRARQETTESGARWGIPKFGIVSYARACSMLL